MTQLKTKIVFSGLSLLFMVAGCLSEYEPGSGKADIGLPERGAFNNLKQSNEYPHPGQNDTEVPVAFEGDFFGQVSRSNLYLGRGFSEFWMQWGIVKKAFPTDVNQCFYYIKI